MTESLTSIDEAMMAEALREARRAAAADEVPVGAVVACRGSVVGRGFNQRESLLDPLAHAEMSAIKSAAAALASWRLSDCTLYVTLEPCVMCAGAIVQARINRLVYGCLDPKGGGVKSLYRLCDDKRLNHRPIVDGGVLETECSRVLKDFFAGLRAGARSGRAERWPSPVEGA